MDELRCSILLEEFGSSDGDNKMDDIKINKIIAEFVGDDGFCFGQGGSLPKLFTKSLDALIPVWEKLRNSGVWLNVIGNRSYNHFALFSDKPIEEYSPFYPFYFYESLDKPTIQQAAAHSTAKAILELEKTK